MFPLKNIGHFTYVCNLIGLFIYGSVNYTSNVYRMVLYTAHREQIGDHNPTQTRGVKIMKTLNANVVNFVSSNIIVTPTVQEYFNGMLEGLSFSEILVGSYYNSLSPEGKGLFGKLFISVTEEVSSVAKVIKTRSIKLRKQISAMAKRSRKAKKVDRSTSPIFTVNLFQKMEVEAGLLLRRVGITPTDTPILELMSISVEEAGFLFNTEGLCNSLKAVLNMAAKVLAV